jgi:hypothetical protein
MLFIPGCYHAHKWHKDRREAGKMGIGPVHVVLLGLVIALAGAVWMVARPAQIAVAAAPAAAPAETPVKEVATALSDVPKKIAAIDQARDILHKDVEDTLNDGFRILNEGMTALGKGDRMPLMKGIPEYYQTWAALWKRIEDFRKSYDGFEDINSILDQTYRPKLEKGFASLQGAVGSLGDPPYKFDMGYFFSPHVQEFNDGMMEWGKWMHATDAKLLTLRKKLSG